MFLWADGVLGGGERKLPKTDELFYGWFLFYPTKKDDSSRYRVDILVDLLTKDQKDAIKEWGKAIASILSKSDPKGPKWTFLTVPMPDEVPPVYWATTSVDSTPSWQPTLT